MPSCALITVCCIVLPPLKDKPIFLFNGFVFILLILKIADGFWFEIMPKYCQEAPSPDSSGWVGGHEKYTAPPVPSGKGCCPVKNTLKVYAKMYEHVRGRMY